MKSQRAFVLGMYPYFFSIGASQAVRCGVVVDVEIGSSECADFFMDRSQHYLELTPRHFQKKLFQNNPNLEIEEFEKGKFPSRPPKGVAPEMKISLAVQVFNGGAYWQQCWASIIANIDLFENVFVSISESPHQKKDIETVQKLSFPNVHLLVHNLCMSAVEHGSRFDEWVSSFQLSGHVFILCHDDILLREGLLALKKLNLSPEEAVLGPWQFFSDDGSIRPLIAKQFRKLNGKPLSSQEFGFMVDQQFYLLNVSGIVIPAEIFKSKRFPWHLCSFGCRSEYLHLCDPSIKYIHQLAIPAVKVRRHSASESALMTEKANQFDTLLYLILAFKIYPLPWTRKFTLQSFCYMLKKSPRSGVKALLQAQINLWKKDFISSGEILHIWFGIGKAVCKKIFNRISSVFRKQE